MHTWNAYHRLRRAGVSGLGMTQEQIIEDFPELTTADIRACLEFAADRERKLVSIPPV